MKISTLSYIHALLIEDEKKKGLAAKWQRELWLKADEENAPNKDELKKVYDHLHDDYNKAYAALQDFELHEW